LLPAGVPRAADAPAPPAPFAVPGARAIASPAGTSGSAAAGADERHLLQLGAGDSVNVQVYGQPDMDTTVYVGDDGTISVPLAGSVQVGGLTPVEAQKRVEQALRQGQFLLDPHVTISVTQSRSQRVSVLGEIKDPGRYPIEPNTTVFDLLAQAGGVTAFSSDIIYILRPDASGKVNRYPINLKGFSDQKNALPTQTLQAGDSVYVPRAEQFYIYGEVAAPNMYRIEPGMTVIQAIARAGGITPRGSEHRIEIKRSGKDGKYVITHAKPGDLVQSDDVIRVKESIF
jgi:polysaccharide export outer membrane protein